MSEDAILTALEQLGLERTPDDEFDLTEETLIPGEYILNATLNEDFSRGRVVILKDLKPVGKFSQTFIYKTEEDCYVTFDNLR
jgi:hypothetical protein